MRRRDTDHRQHLRRHRRGRTPGAPGDPPCRPNPPGCAHRCHRLRRAIDPAAWAALPGVARVLGNVEKLQPESWAPGAPSAVADIMTARETSAHLVTEFAGRARAFVQVQQGCDHRCTFCVIPFGRGPSRSVPMGAVVSQVRALVAAGYHEVVLTGVDIASYGADLPGAPALGAAGPPAAGAGAGACRGCGCPRSTRRRSTTSCGGWCRGAAADAASAFVVAGGQRPDPEAHEAAASRAPMRWRRSRAPARCGRGSRSAPT